MLPVGYTCILYLQTKADTCTCKLLQGVSASHFKINNLTQTLRKRGLCVRSDVIIVGHHFCFKWGDDALAEREMEWEDGSAFLSSPSTLHASYHVLCYLSPTTIPSMLLASPGFTEIPTVMMSLYRAFHLSFTHPLLQCQSHTVILNDRLLSHFFCKFWHPRDIKSSGGPNRHCGNAYFWYPECVVVWIYSTCLSLYLSVAYSWLIFYWLESIWSERQRHLGNNYFQYLHENTTA